MSDPGSREAHRRLLADTLQGSWTEGPAAAMAQRAAVHARRRRKRRRAAVASSLLAAVLALAWSLRREVQPMASPSPAQTIARAPGYEIISDDEMMTLLADRPILVLPRENHTPQIVLLGR